MSKMPSYYQGINGKTEVPNEAELVELLTPAVRECYEHLNHDLRAKLAHPSHFSAQFVGLVGSTALQVLISIHRENSGTE